MPRGIKKILAAPANSTTTSRDRAKAASPAKLTAALPVKESQVSSGKGKAAPPAKATGRTAARPKAASLAKAGHTPQARTTKAKAAAPVTAGARKSSASSGGELNLRVERLEKMILNFRRQMNRTKSILTARISELEATAARHELQPERVLTTGRGSKPPVKRSAKVTTESAGGKTDDTDPP